MPSPFASMQTATGDPIFELTERFKKDTNPKKVNLGIGVYQNEDGITPLLDVVQETARKIVAESKTGGYLPLDGLPAYNQATQCLLFGENSPVIREGRVVTAQTPGGTGALRVGADFIRRILNISTIHVSNPTWVNHPKVFQAAGLEVKDYPYFSPSLNGLDFSACIDTIQSLAPGSVVLFHASCHNPTGADFSHEQWNELVEICEHKALIPFFDFAYQGFVTGVDEDAYPMRLFAERGLEFIVASSYSKSFSLYGERVGALTIVLGDADRAKRAVENVKGVIRPNYSNPPSFGARIIAHILNDKGLFACWEVELGAMRDRIKQMRKLFVAALAENGMNMPYIVKQNGMFSFLGIKPEHADRLAQEFGIYMVRSGRICVAAMNTKNLPYVCESIVKVVKG